MVYKISSCASQFLFVRLEEAEEAKKKKKNEHMTEKKEPFPDYYVKEADNFLTSLNPKQTPDIDDFIQALSCFNEDVAKGIEANKDEFKHWYPSKSKDHRLRLLRDWCGETSVTCKAQSPAADGEEYNSSSSHAAAGNSVDAKKSGASTPHHNSSIHSTVTHYQTPTAPVKKQTKVRKMPWHEFMCRVLQITTGRIKPNCIPMMGDLIRHITCNGVDVPPHFTFVIHPLEEEKYYQILTSLMQVIAECKAQNIRMADGLHGEIDIVSLPDGRKQFFLRTEKGVF